MRGDVRRACRSLYGLKQVSRQWHHQVSRGLRGLGFEQCEADACVVRLLGKGAVSIEVVVHVGDIFMIRYDKICEDSTEFVPMNNLGGLPWYAGCRFLQDRDARTFTISQQGFAEVHVTTFGVTRGESTPMMVDLKLHEFDKDGPNVDEPFQSWVGHFMWLVNKTRLDIVDAVRAVARYSAARMLLHWQAALRIAMYI